MLIKLIASRLACLLSLALICSTSLANPLKVIEFDKSLLTELPSLQNAKIAFIDLSAKKLGPKITITNLGGDLLESFLIPADRYSPEWTNWGSGISYDTKKKPYGFYLHK